MIVSEEFITELKNKSVAELDEILKTMDDIKAVVIRLRDYKQALAILNKKVNK